MSLRAGDRDLRGGEEGGAICAEGGAALKCTGPLLRGECRGGEIQRLLDICSSEAYGEE